MRVKHVITLSIKLGFLLVLWKLLLKRQLVRFFLEDNEKIIQFHSLKIVVYSSLENPTMPAPIRFTNLQIPPAVIGWWIKPFSVQKLRRDPVYCVGWRQHRENQSEKQRIPPLHHAWNQFIPWNWHATWILGWQSTRCLQFHPRHALFHLDRNRCGSDFHLHFHSFGFSFTPFFCHFWHGDVWNLENP